jgi:hypothetical protein
MYAQLKCMLNLMYVQLNVRLKMYAKLMFFGDSIDE